MRLRACLQLALSAVAALSLWGCAAHPARQASPDPQVLAHDMDVFQSLLQDHALIRRDVTQLENGVQAVTESDDPRIAAKLVEHVMAMESRLHHGIRVREWDPLYVAVFDHAGQIDLQVTPTAKGVKVVETSKDPYVVELIRAHARTVSGFAAEGAAESARSHPVPPRS